MKTIFSTPSIAEARQAHETLLKAHIYAANSGSRTRGYEILVRDVSEEAARKLLGTANAKHGAQEHAPEANACE
jgi:hypothetical protein